MAVTTMTSGDIAVCHHDIAPRHERVAAVTTVTRPFRACHLSPAARAPSFRGDGTGAKGQDQSSLQFHHRFESRVLPRGGGLRGTQTPIQNALQTFLVWGGQDGKQ